LQTGHQQVFGLQDAGKQPWFSAELSMQNDHIERSRRTPGGLPPGEEAWIAEMNLARRILQVKNGRGKWTGKHKAVEDALAALAEKRLG